MTMIERAAIAVAAALTDGPVDPKFSLAEVNGWTEEKSYEIARAVLLAVREPDVELSGRVFYYSTSTNQAAEHEKRFTAMIDAILEEPK